MRKVIVITGGIGSGKSEVCKILSRLGYTDQYNADSRVKALYTSCTDLVDKLEILLDMTLRDEEGEFKPSILANKIFSDRGSLEKVESVVFPVLMKDFGEFAEKARTGIIIFESATVLEKRYFEFFGDTIILVDAPLSIRLGRAMKRDTANEEAIIARMNNQKMMNSFSDYGIDAIGADSPWYASAKRVDYVIDTNCSLEELENRVKIAMKTVETKML